MFRKNLVKLASLCAALFPAAAVADGARDWINAPVDTNFFYFYYMNSDAHASLDSSLPLKGATLDSHVTVLRFARTFSMNGRISAVQLVLPYAKVDGSIDGTGIGRSLSGTGDIQAIFVTSIYGAPAMSLEQIMESKPQDFLAASFAITAPTGKYDRFRLLNIGKNRWAFKPQLSWGKYFSDGSLLAVNANAQFFTENDEHLGLGSLKQDPLYTIEAHYSRNISRPLWVSLDGYYTFGGETKIGGVKQGNRQETLRLGLSANMNLSLTDAVAINYSQTVSKEEWTPDAKIFSISYSKMW